MAILHVNNTNFTPNYSNYSEALLNASDGDTIKVYHNDILLFEFIYTKHKKPISEDTRADEMTKFLYTVLKSNNDKINKIKNGKKIYFNQNNNKFKLDLLTNSKKEITGENNFVGSKLKVPDNATLPTELLVGISDEVKYINKSNDIGFHVKQINPSQFVPADNLNTQQNISIVPLVPTSNLNFEVSLSNKSKDMTKNEFMDKVFKLNNNYLKKVSFIKNSTTNYNVVKRFEKNYIMELPTDGTIMVMDPGRYTEYAINLLNHSQDQNDQNFYSLSKRSARELYNNGAAPTKGEYNGWKYNKNTQNTIEWTLYNYKFDTDITTETLNYFWITIYQPTNQSQTIYLQLIKDSTVTELSCTTVSNFGRQLLWFSSSSSNVPTNVSGQYLFNVRFEGSGLTNISSAKILTKSTNQFYIESYGFTTNARTENKYLRQSYDHRVGILNQVNLSSEAGYNLMLKKFMNNNSSYPMDKTKTNMTDILIDEMNNGSVGWYFNSESNQNLNLLSYRDINKTLGRDPNKIIQYNEFHTLFIELIITNPTNVSISCFNKTTTLSLGTGHKLIYINSNPLTEENYALLNKPQNQISLSLVTANTKYISNVNAGVHNYTVTFVTKNGETQCGPISSINVINGHGNVILDNIPISTNPNIIARNIYRSSANNITGELKFLTRLNDNTTTRFYDTIKDEYLGKLLNNTDTTNTSYPFPYFTYLNTNLTDYCDNINLFLSSNIGSNDIFNNLYISGSIDSNYEIISYGFKLLNYEPTHLMTRWSSLENNEVVHNIDGFLTLQKDVVSLVETQEIVTNAKFRVKAYGDFFQGSYEHNTLTNEYSDIKVNVSLNEMAVNNALYILDEGDINNYTIDIDGLKFQADGSAIVNNNGVATNNKVLFNNKKYIICSILQNSTKSDFIVTSNNFDILTQNSGLSAVILQGMYAGLFKQFNKSSTLLNSLLYDSLNQSVAEVNKPTLPLVEYSTIPSNNLTPDALYSYRITYYTSVGETDSSIPSENIQVSITNPTKINIKIPVSLDTRVIGRKIYRRFLGRDNNQYFYIASVGNNTDLNYLDDMPNPTNLNIPRPVFTDIKTNETNYITPKLAYLLEFKESSLTSNAAYKYRISYYVNSDGVIMETLCSDESAILRVGQIPSKMFVNLPICPDNVTGRKIYRTQGDGNDFTLLDTIPNNYSTLYIDSKSDSEIVSNNRPLDVATLNLPKPNLVYVGGIYFIRLYDDYQSLNLIANAEYKYKITYVVSTNTGTELGETEPSDVSNVIIEPGLKPNRILLNLPISPHQNVIKRRIYRTPASGTIYKLITTINDNKTTIFIDNTPDSKLGRIISDTNTTNIIAPTINTTVSSTGNISPVSALMSDLIREVNIPVTDSSFFNIYNRSGRFNDDMYIYNSQSHDNLPEYYRIQMNLENIEVNFKIKLRGGMYSGTDRYNKTGITRELAELIFGKFNNNTDGIINEPDTLVREVTRIGNTTKGVDEEGNTLDMINNELNESGSYLILKEIQYEIVFIITLVQKTL